MTEEAVCSLQTTAVLKVLARCTKPTSLVQMPSCNNTKKNSNEGPSSGSEGSFVVTAFKHMSLGLGVLDFWHDVPMIKLAASSKCQHEAQNANQICFKSQTASYCVCARHRSGQRILIQLPMNRAGTSRGASPSCSWSSHRVPFQCLALQGRALTPTYSSHPVLQLCRS